MPETQAPVSAQQAKVNALEKAFAALGRPLSQARDVKQAPTVVRSTQVRVALEEFARHETVESLTASQPNIKQLAKDLFDWATPDQQTRATGAVVKAIGRAVLATGEDGTSRYPQLVEMLGFAAAAAPLLQPDRLARLIDEAPKVSTAFGTDMYTLRLSAPLRGILSRYQDQRREDLLVSLWHAAHDGRWWDLTSGVIEIDNAETRARRNAEREAAERIVANATDGGDINDDAVQEAVTTLLLSSQLPYNPATRDLIAQLRPTARLRDGMLNAAERMRAGDPVHPDTTLLLSAVSWASPKERPESPIGWLARNLHDLLVPDPVTGEVVLEELPKKPKTWAELYPEDDPEKFPLPQLAYVLDGKEFRGTNVRMVVIQNATQLQENATYMGNCTYSYLNLQQRGTYVLFQLWEGGSCFNTSLVWRDGSWRIGEVNSRFNQGNVPERIRDISEQLAGGMTEAQVRDVDPAQRVKRKRTFSTRD